MKPFIWIFLLIIFVLACNLSREKKTGTPLRTEKSFNSDWYFAIDSVNTGEKQHWFTASEIPADKVSVSLPHTWNVMDGFESYYGTGWYFKFFDTPGNWKGKVIRLKFNAIYRDADIWINGHSVKKRRGAGYTPFEVDISDHLYFNQHNLIVLKVSNEFSGNAIPFGRKFDWPADGGIIRRVSLIKTESSYITYLHVQPELKSGNTGILKIKIGIAGLDDINTGSMDVWWQIMDYKPPTSKALNEGNQKIRISNSEINLEIKMGRIRPWHFNRPDLYRLRVAVGDQYSLRDHAETTFGFRSFLVSGDRLLFNGESVRLPGIEWMPGSNPDQGMAEDSSTMATMLTLIKGTNAVLTRFHWQQDEFILDWCDQNGLLVQEEIPLWQAPFPEQLNEELREMAYLHISEMIKAHYNHPSIIAWGIGNELQAQNDTINEFLEDLKHFISNLDSFRLVNYVSNTFQVQPDRDGTTIGDLLMWNDYSGLWYNMSGNGLTSEMLPETLIDFNQMVSNKPLVISEYGLCEPVFKGGDPRRIDHFLYNTNIYDQDEWIAGVIYFSLNDYRTHMGEEGVGKFRQRVHGIADLFGNKKPSYDVVRKRFSPIRNLEAKVINQNLHVTGQNHNGLPSYTLYNYRVRVYGLNEQLIGEEPIPDLHPGQKFNVVFRGIRGSVRMIRIMTGNDYPVASIQL